LFKHLSYSHLHLLACPYSAFLKYQAAVKGPTTKWIAIGNAVHHAIEHAHEEEGFNLEAAKQLFKEEFARIIEAEMVSIGWPEIKKMEAEAVEMLVVYNEQVSQGIISPKPLALEQEFKIPFLDTVIVGKIDKLERDENGFIVTDFKTGKSKPTQFSLRHNVQLSTYAWAVQEMYGEIPHTLIWHHLRTGELLTTTRTQVDIDDVKQMVGNAIAMNEAGIRTRIFHDNVCGMCDYQGAMCEDRELEKETLAALEIGERVEPRIYIKPPKWSA
jgi:hypothetical protein